MTTLGRAASLGDTLRHIRESKDMTLRAASAATGISNAYISQIETGRIVTPSPTFLRRLALGYGVSYDELMRVAGYTDATHDATPIAPPPTLGRAASLRIAYASAMQDVQRLTAERDALRAKTKAIDESEHVHGVRIMALKEEVARLNRAIVEHADRNEYAGSCSWCEAYTVNDGDVLKHKFGCILIKARQQKEAFHG